MIQYAIDQLAIENNTIAYLTILGASDEQVSKHIQRRDYYAAVVEQFEEVGQ